MTEISSVKAHADHQPTPVAIYSAPPPFSEPSPALDGTIEEEESSVIKCICGYQEDDGSTVLCEKCDTWQHIVCYYDNATRVPDVHECTDCHPRPVDARGAAEKQRQRRELQNIGERRGKPKAAPKSGKKRAKDPLGQVQLNGWAVHANSELHYGTERKSGSPRDQPPPSKRPKTTHRSSASLSMPNQTPNLVPGSRKRAGSTLHNGMSPTKSPTNLAPSGCVVEEFSPEFMQLYRQPEPPSIDSNSYTDIRVANDIALWLNDREALAQATDGMEPSQIFERVEQTIEELESMAPSIVKQNEEDTQVTNHGLHPQWQYLTVESFVPANGYIGELKGHIGRRADYFSTPSNRWELLQHPEPFVFFPPHLPIYIDTRREGTILRYVRRSCRPNMRMKILTQSREGGYHFCFTASEDIHPEDELTIGWEITPETRQLLQNSMTNGDIRKEGFKKLEHLSHWISGVLSNFGGCACQHRSKETPCFLDLARRPAITHEPAKTTKSKKKKQVSPLSTGRATNSRAGSEAFHRDGQDEDMDSRSTSGSRSKPNSRDITPMTHFSVDGDLKMSDRERRKIQQQERLFEQLEYDEQHGSKRRKRNSAGSALNTPGLSSSVRRSPRPSIFEANLDPQKQLGHPESSSHRTREHSNGVARKASNKNSKANGCPPLTKPRAVYVDSSTQTEPVSRMNAPATPLNKKREMKLPLSFKRRLLKDAVSDRLHRERSRSVKVEISSPALDDVASAKSSPVSPVAQKDIPMADSTGSNGSAEVSSPKSAPVAPTEDVEMKDVAEAPEAPVASPKASSPKVEEMPDAPAPEPVAATSHPPIQPDPPPWPATPSAESPAPSTAPSIPSPPKPAHLQIPPHPVPETPQPSSISQAGITPASTPSVLPGVVVAQSPLSAGALPSPFSPSVANAISAAGPPRKKLSLSDWTNRKAKLAQSQSSTGTTTAGAQAPVSSQMNPVSSPSTASNPPLGSPAKSPEITATGSAAVVAVTTTGQDETRVTAAVSSLLPPTV